MPEQNSSSSNYGFFARQLHKLVLDYPFIGETIFDIEQAARRTPSSSIVKPVFIAGLARSGTTALLASLYETGEFRSLTYNDMPFILMPSVWRKLSGREGGVGKKIERAHGDGILVDADSPEAFEEVFWRTFCHMHYIHDDHLSPHEVDRVTLEKFRLFVGSVVDTANNPRKKRYLSKNNNNLLRIPALKKAFPDSIVIIPFRNPVHQSISLLNQHGMFCQLHGQDNFSLKYMNWLAHHEFGLGHKPFRFDAASGDMDSRGPDNINYWLTIWNNSYQYILRTATPDCYFLCYERLCEHTAEELTRLYCRADIPLGNEVERAVFASPPEKTADGADLELVSRCNQTYESMVLRNGRIT